MIVNQQNFLKESNNLIQKLPTASFFTLNLQLTGRNIPNASRPSKFDQPFERYSQLKNSPERYSIIQMGICLFHENPDFRRYAKRFVGEGGENDDEDGGEDGDAAGEHPAAENIRDREQLEDARNQENMMPLHNYNHANQDHNNNNNLSDDESDEHSYISSSSSDQSSDSDSDGGGENGRGPERDDGNDHAHENRNANENVNVNANANENANVNNDHVENNDNGNDNQHQEQQQQQQQEQHQPGDQPNDDPNGQPDHLPNIGLPILFDRLRNHNRHRNRNHNRDQNRAGGRRRPEPPEFHVRKYNFFLFPSSNSSAREVVLNPAMMTQLCGGRQDRNRTNGNGRDVDEENVAQDVDFNEWMKNGITYTTLEQAEAIMKKFQLDHDKKLNGNSNGSEHANGNGTNDEKDGAQNRGATNGARVTEWDEPTDPSDIAFIARTMASLREWIDQAALPSVPLSDNMSLEQEERIGIVKVIPVPKKESLRRCLRGKIEFEYPSLHWDENDNQQVVIRLNDDEKKIRDARRKKFAWQKMHEERIGFTRVFKALSDACRGQLGQIEDFDSEYQHFCAKFEESDDHSTSGSPSALKGDGSPISVTAADLTKLSRVQQRQIPMILHDGFLDFLFLLTHFQKHKLPPTYEEAKEMLHRFFPVVYDTKILASEFSDNAVKINKTSAYDLYRRFVRGRGDDVFEEDHEFVGGRIPRSLLVNGSTLSLTHPEADENPDLNPGDNAFIIGTVFQCLCRRIKWRSLQSPTTEEREREMFSQIVSAKRSRVGSLLFLDQRHAETKLCAPLYGLNKVFLHQSIFTVDMEAVHDPLKPGYTMTAIFKVMHPNKIVTLNEINRIIKGIRDPGFAGRHSQPKIHYEIGLTSKWFIVAARNKIPRGMNPSDSSANAFAAATLERRATLLLDALKSNFPECEITSLENAVLSSTSGWSSLKRGKKRSIRQTDQVERDDDNNGILGALYSTVRSGLRRRLRVE